MRRRIHLPVVPPATGRGTNANLPNRFERLHVAPDPEEAAEEAAGRETIVYRDPSRSVLTRNNSPDVGFEWSVNPYRGCEHGCVYCLAPDTPILYEDFTWRPLGEVRTGDRLVGFDETPEPGRVRKLRPAEVQAVWWSRRRTLRLVTERAQVLATPEHLWLQARDFRWSRTDRLTPGRRLRHLPQWETAPFDDPYRVGYLTGLTIGDGTFRYEPGWRSDRLGFPAAYWRIALRDPGPLRRTAEFLLRFGIQVPLRPFSPGRERPAMLKVETRALGQLEVIHGLLTRELPGQSYRRGFLAGFFDAEGPNGTSLRLFQRDRYVLDRVRDYGRTLGFDLCVEPPRENGVKSLRLRGSLADRMRFFGICCPAIARKREAIFHRRPPTVPERVAAVESGRVVDVVDIQTSTGTFYAAGLATHNCYARPTHEYLGFSAGLDFESRIVAKTDAPRLLARRLRSPRWKPATIVMSGVTDPYQPVERRLGITRGCMEVFAAARHPVAVITKSDRILRDLDLLASLAEVGAAGVSISITTLERRLQRAMEPRAATPERRLEAIRRLTEAGVPVGVNVAPIVPGLTDHELPEILEAARAAGARFAGRILLRLPHGVKELFLAWLERTVPERAAKVQARIRETRGGELYDSTWGSRMSGEGLHAELLQRVFRVHAERLGFERRPPGLSAEHFRREAVPDRDDPQLGLFG
jgi:DNA repair photolyase